MIVYFFFFIIEHKQKINSYSSKQILTTNTYIFDIKKIYKDIEK